MHKIFDSQDSTTNRSCNLVVRFIFYDLILTHAIVGSFEIIRLTVGLLFQFFVFRNILIYAVADDKTI